MATAFISYTHADEGLKDQFLQHLAPLRREGLIRVWHDRMLRAGDHLDENIQRELGSSDLVILLISAAFLHSEYCYEEEMQRAFDRQREGRARVVAVILRPCQWKNVPVGAGQTLSSFLAVPKDGKPVTTWLNADEAFDGAVGSIRGALLGDNHAASGSRPRDAKGEAVEQPASTPDMRASIGASGASSLLKPRITDRDRDRYLRDALQLTARMFEERLRQISEEPRIESDFERVDSRTFIATVYADGDKAGECRIFAGAEHFGNSLCLSFDASSRNSMNEWLSLETSEGEIGFKASGMRFGRDRDAQLDGEAAADYLWNIFIEHVKARIR